MPFRREPIRSEITKLLGAGQNINVGVSTAHWYVTLLRVQ